MTTPPDPNAPVTPDAPPPATDAPPPDAPPPPDTPADPTAGGGTPDAPPSDPGTATPPDAPQVTSEDTGNGGDQPPMQDETDKYIPSMTSNETPLALPIQYEQYPVPPG